MTQIAKIGKSTDHMVAMSIDLEDGGDPIVVTMPLFPWIPRPKVRAMNAWAEDMQKAATAYTEWEKKGSKGKPPCDPDTLPDAPHKYQVRILRDYVSDEDFARLWLDATPGHAQDIFDVLNGEGEIELGESAASSAS